jgi:NhaA family Na+:H+ antiporter
MRVTEDNEYEAEDADFRRLEFAARESISPLERLETALHPWVGFVIMPLFALANAGVAIRVNDITHPVALAVDAGLVLGKPLGIVGFSFLAVRLGLATLPTGVTWRMMVAAGCLGGIGFTMSLFVDGLAFAGRPDLLDDGKIGIITGSLISAILGSALLAWSLRTAPARQS